MSFSRNSRFIQLDATGVLHADCQRSDGSSYVPSQIQLNAHIGNNNGSFQWGGNSFSLTSQNVALDGTILSGILTKRDRETTQHAYIDLDEHIANVDGTLTMVLESYPHPVDAPGPTSRSEAWKKKFSHVDFKLFEEGDSDAVPNSYIVNLSQEKDSLEHIGELAKFSELSSRDSKFILKIKHQYKLMNGYAAELSGEGLLRVAESTDVTSITSDTKGTPMWGADGVSWGLQAISSRDPFLAGADPNALVYHFEGQNGQHEVDVYLIDSGVNNGVPELAGRVASRVGVDGQGNINAQADTNDNAPVLHGTPIAGIIAAIAPTARIHSIKTLRHPDGRGSFYATTTENLAALDWVDQQVRTSGKPSIINFSIVHPRWLRLRNQFTELPHIGQSVDALIQANVPVCAAAGNHNPAARNPNQDPRNYVEDASNYTPGHLGSVITVAALDITRQLCDFSNRGLDVTILAPGHDIMFAGTAYSGTSFAAPHVTGVAANMLSNNVQAPVALNIMNQLIDTSTPLPPMPHNTPSRLVHN